MTEYGVAGTRARRPVRALVGLLLAVAIVAAPAVPGLASPAQAVTKWQSGVYTGTCDKSALTAFGTWRHSAVERTSAYLNAQTWGQLTTLKFFGHCLTGIGVPITFSVPMLPLSYKQGKAHLVTGAAGKYNKYWLAFGKTMVADGYSRATLRLGWEMNGNWYPWNAEKDPKHWVSYWRQIVKTLRKVPNQHFTFEWSPALGVNGPTHFRSTKVYPGDAYVTYIGSTVYDQWWGKKSATVAQRWAHLTNQDLGLKWLASFAKKHHKKVAVAEWGLASKASFSGHGDGDNPYFISHFYAWMKTANMAYDIYFNRYHSSDHNDHRMLLGTTKTNIAFLKAAKAYRKTFGGL
ncbi:MAG TPA: glycosyl hydrolase [Actinomycetes bacterium]|nr:glycosyl hydrolase [Actinomycetes bacterium]